MTDKERKEIFEHRADRAAWNVKLMSYTAFKCALADAERRFMESADQILPTPSIPPQYADVPASDQTDMVGAEAVLMKYHLHHEDELGITWGSAITAMHRFASIQVEKVRKELDETIKYWVDWNRKRVAECARLESELSAAQSRIAELEEIDKYRLFVEAELTTAKNRIAELEKELNFKRTSIMERIEKVKVGDTITFIYKGGRKVKLEVLRLGKNAVYGELLTDYLGKNVDWYAGENKDFNKSEMKKVVIVN